MQPSVESKRPEGPLDCAWCKAEFVHIVELLAHVDERHLAAPVAPLVA